MNKMQFRFALGAYIVGIFILSAIPGTSLPNQLFPQWDKLVHFVEYFILGFLVVKNVETVKPSMFIVLILAGIGIAGLDETWQSFQPGRDSSFLDMLADGIGYICGSFLAVNQLKQYKMVQDNG